MKNAITDRNKNPQKASRQRKWLPRPHFGLWLKPDRRLLWMDRQYPQKSKNGCWEAVLFFSLSYFFFSEASNPNISSNRKPAPCLSRWSQNCRWPQNNMSRSHTTLHRALLQTGDRGFPSINSTLSFLPFIPAVCVAAQWPLRLSVSMSCRW